MSTVLYPDGWTRRLTTVPPNAHIVSEIGPVSDVYLLATASGTLLVSTDAGFTWQTRSLPWKEYRTFFVLGSASGQLFISTEMAGPDQGEVFGSGDYGVTWGRIAWPVDRGPLASTMRTLVDGSKQASVWANYSGVVVDHLGLCLTDGATLWCRIGTAFIRVPGVRPLIAQGGGVTVHARRHRRAPGAVLELGRPSVDTGEDAGLIRSGDAVQTTRFASPHPMYARLPVRIYTTAVIGGITMA